MKKQLVATLCMLLLCETLFAQVQDTVIKLSPQMLHDKYIKKRNDNLLMGWITLGTGATMFIIGAAKVINSISVPNPIDLGALSFPNKEEPDRQVKGVALTIIGIGTCLGSIPLFIGAEKNKHKAKLTLTEQKVTVNNTPAQIIHYPALSVAFTIRQKKHASIHAVVQ